MDRATTRKLLALNHRFYSEFGREFSETRARLQPGVLRVLRSLRGSESILDLGCGNGELARTLSRQAWKGSYLGLDFSLPLLSEAEREAFGFPVKFIETDLSSPDWEAVVRSNAQPEAAGLGRHTPSIDAGKLDSDGDESFDLVFCFAVLHHVPGIDLRLNLIRNTRELLKPDGRFIHSNWQFLTSPRFVARIQAWESVGLSPGEVDPGDYLLDWKRGGTGLRYVHHFENSELEDLAQAGGYEVSETFYSDGQNQKLSLYQIWQKLEQP